MAQRVLLHNLLKALTPNVYFQPPSDALMVFPCIRYERSSADNQFAGNSKYLRTTRYTVTVITEDPDSPIPDAVAALPLCSDSTHFVVEHLYHDVFDIFH